MKLWASASAIGLSAAYFATGCSSEPPPDDNMINPGGGNGTTAGSNGTAGTPAASGSGTGGAPGGGNPGGGVGPVAGTGGTPPGGGTPGGGTGGTPPAGAETEIACPQGVLGHCSMGETYPTYPGYTLALVEDFPVAIDLNADPIFTWSDGSPADGQTGFHEEGITFADGNMILTASSPCAAKTTNAACIEGRMAYGEAMNPNAMGNVGAMGVWSGELRSKYNNYRYGRYEAKYKAPIANPGQETTNDMSGNYLSTLFVFRTPKNVKWNEIDIELEPWHHNETAGNIVNATGATGYPGGNASPFSVAGPAGYEITQEHIYAFNWTPTLVEWFVDGQKIHEFAGSGNVPIPNLSAKIMMNLWIFSGTTFGDGVNNKFPFHATYDWFRFYKLDTEATYPCANPPACLPAEDKTKSAQNNPKEMNYGI